MKIAYIGSRGFPGFNAGVEKSLEEICPRLSARGHEVTLYCSEHVSTPEPVYKGTYLRRTASIPTKHFDTLSRTVLSSLDALRQRYDIIHFHSIGPALLSWLGRFGTAKTVVTVHGLDWQRAKWGALARLSLKIGERSSVLFPQETIVVSKHLQRHFEKNYGKKVTFIPNGVNLHQPVEAEIIKKKWGLEKNSYVLFASRLVPEKECHTLIQAFRKVRTDLRLVIAGSSWHSDDYVKQLKSLAAEDSRILFTGWAEGQVLEELYSNARFYCLPSKIEGLSLALLEAMSYGLCPLVSNIPENTDVVGSSGETFQVGDAADLARHLEGLIQDPERCRRLGEQAREEVSREYSWDRDVEMTEQVYQRLLN